MKQLHPNKSDTEVSVSISVDANIADTEDLYGKVASDLQEGITITDNAITGTLKLVSGYTGFSEDVSKQSGNYLALHFSATDDATLSAEYGSETVSLTEDGLIVIRVTDVSVPLVVTATLGNVTETESYDLTGLTLADS